eukprot:10256004-Karenia_brevis.AAC.1
MQETRLSESKKLNIDADIADKNYHALWGPAPRGYKKGRSGSRLTPHGGVGIMAQRWLPILQGPFDPQCIDDL